MIWKNPFLTKNSEQQFSAEEYLRRFDSTVLKMIEDKNLTTVSYVSSTPGAGKTSLFRAFMPEILSFVANSKNQDEFREMYQQMDRLQVIYDNKVIMASAILSCARNYSILDDMFQNGRKKQIFFALLNYRIAIVLMRNIGVLLDLEPDEFDRITFCKIPGEMLSEEEHFINGKRVYQWACMGERELCQYLDSERTEQIEISFVHTTLLIIKLFEPENILVNEEKYFHNVLLIFDDFHKLSNSQKEDLSDAVYTLKASTGIWFGQRLEGVRDEQIISMDGSLSREYNSNIVIDNYWPEKFKAYYKMLENIADRRAIESQDPTCTSFKECISEELTEKKYSNILNQFINGVERYIQEDERCNHEYQEVINYLNCNQIQLFDKAIWYECIIIKEKRKNNGQLAFYLGEQEDVEKFKDFVKENKKAAWFYICDKYDIPFYIGMENLKSISSFNIEQFLVFAGAYFDNYRIKTLGGKSSKRKMSLTCEEQWNILKKIVYQRWEDMNFRYKNIGEIKVFLTNIANLGIRSKKEERASYGGGAYTGIGLKKWDLDNKINNAKYSRLIKILGACVASKYLERRESDKGDEVIFYLNRWLCVYFMLPLAYGGFHRCSLEKALSFCTNNTIDQEDGQIELSFTEE